jgi:RNA polymerase subunit RPABC4/transcription elongation factor Spt4
MIDGTIFREVVFVGGWPDAALVNGLLESEGIITMLAADQAFTRFRGAVYVLDADQVQIARTLVDRFVRHEPTRDPKSYRSWRCRSCNELIEGQFDLCWKCGSESRPA